MTFVTRRIYNDNVNYDNYKTTNPGCAVSGSVKSELLAKADSLTDGQKFDLEEKCWAPISADYKNRLNFEVQKRMHEMAKGDRTYSKEDFKKVEDDLFSELVNRLKTTENQEEINKVRQQLQSV